MANVYELNLQANKSFNAGLEMNIHITEQNLQANKLYMYNAHLEINIHITEQNLQTNKLFNAGLTL